MNAILPGWIDTDLTRGARAELPGLNEGVLARTPAGRWGTPADCAGVVVFLASGASAFGPPPGGDSEDCCKGVGELGWRPPRRTAASVSTSRHFARR
jgi:hypothetical protein